MLDGPGGSIENDALGIKKLLLKTQVSLTSFLQSEVKIVQEIMLGLEPRICCFLCERAYIQQARYPDYNSNPVFCLLMYMRVDNDQPTINFQIGEREWNYLGSCVRFPILSFFFWE